MKVAIIGVGRMGRLHATNLARLPEVDEVLVSDADPATTRAVAAEIGGRACAGPDEAIELADAVAIASTTPTHASLIEAAVAAGRPIFVEKPLAFTLEESIAVAAPVFSTSSCACGWTEPCTCGTGSVGVAVTRAATPGAPGRSVRRYETRPRTPPQGGGEVRARYGRTREVSRVIPSRGATPACPA